MPSISIIVPAYNAERFLEATLESVLRQTIPDWECIVSDDGSTDGTGAVAQRYVALDPRVRYVRQPNGGRALACNHGYAQAAPESSYLFFLDSDDILKAEALAVMRGYLEEHPEVGVIGCQFQIIDAEGNDLGPGRRSRWVPGWLLPRALKASEAATPFVSFFCATGQGPFAMFRRSVFDRTAGFEPLLSRTSSHEDSDIFCQLALVAPVHYLPDRLYLKRAHGGNVTGDYHRIIEGYITFRAKWDAFEPRNPEEAKVLAAARAFYRQSFFPLREFKVGFKALGETLRNRSLGSLRWSLGHLWSGVFTFVRSRL